MISVGIVGAGSIGGFIGVLLSKDIEFIGEVILLARQSLVEACERSKGLFHLKSVIESQERVFSDTMRADRSVKVAANYSDLNSCDVIILAVKSTQTETVAVQLKQDLDQAKPRFIYSFQNGIGNAAMMKELLSEYSNIQILSAMVGFNAVWNKQENLFSRTSAGELILESCSHPICLRFVQALKNVKLEVRVAEEKSMRNIMYSKLLINLSNAPNALSGLNIPDMLANRDWREVIRLSMVEAIKLYDIANIDIVKVSVKINPRYIPYLFGVPNVIFNILRKTILKLAPDAKTSMLQDMLNGSPTEVDFINGAVVNLSSAFNLSAPVNRLLIELIKKAELRRRESSDSEYWCMTGADVLSEIKKVSIM